MIKNPTPPETVTKKKIDWMITLLPLTIIIVLCILFFFMPEQSNAIISQIRFFLGDTFGTYYLVIGLGVFLISIFVATSKYGNIVLGEQNEKPKYSFFTWGSMMFTAGWLPISCFTHFPNGFYTHLIRILLNWEVFRIGPAYILFSTGA